MLSDNQNRKKGCSLDIHYRHEWKHEISYADLLAIRQRLRAVAESDPHAANGCYLIRSLYFDNAADKALREKIDGVNLREKFTATPPSSTWRRSPSARGSARSTAPISQGTRHRGSWTGTSIG